MNNRRCGDKWKKGVLVTLLTGGYFPLRCSFTKDPEETGPRSKETSLIEVDEEIIEEKESCICMS